MVTIMGYRYMFFKAIYFRKKSPKIDQHLRLNTLQVEITTTTACFANRIQMLANNYHVCCFFPHDDITFICVYHHSRNRCFSMRFSILGDGSDSNFRQMITPRVITQCSPVRNNATILISHTYSWGAGKKNTTENKQTKKQIKHTNTQSETWIPSKLLNNSDTVAFRHRLMKHQYCVSISFRWQQSGQLLFAFQIKNIYFCRSNQEVKEKKKINCTKSELPQKVIAKRKSN